MRGLELRAVHALREFDLDVEFAVREQETLALVGPSGAGKSTVLNLIAGLLSPTSGHIWLNDRILFDSDRSIDLPPDRRLVGYVFQDYALFPHLSVFENIRYGLRARGVGKRESASRVEHWLARLDLKEMERASVSRLSGGQRQRVALARALAAGAELLLLDEPFSSLDVTTRRRVRSELRSAIHATGLPTIIVTHDPLDALIMGDRLAILETGRLTQIGAREALLTQPRTPFAAALLGTNLFHAQLEPGHGLRSAIHPAVTFHVVAEGMEGPVYLAFSPAEVVLANERPTGSAQNVFPARVVSVVGTVDRVRVALNIGAPLLAEVTHPAAAHLALVEGATVWASVKATSIQVYT